MANIYSVTDGGDYNWNDTAAWSGGVVPGKNDVAYIQHLYTQINENGIQFWTGSRDSIRVDSTTSLPDSGSFYTYLYPGGEQLKIDYDSKDSSFLYTCSIDHSHHSWSNAESGSPFIDPKTQAGIGIIQNDARVHSKSTTIYITGSQTVNVNQVYVEDHAKFVIKDQATVYLDSSTADSRIFVRDGILNVLDNYKIDEVVIGGININDAVLGYTKEDPFYALIRKFYYKPYINTLQLSQYHHLLHTYHTYYNSGFKEAIAVIIDAGGSYIPDQGIERESIYVCSPDKINPIWKDFWNSKTTPITSLSPAVMYSHINSLLGFRASEEGKTMGLSSYGKLNSLIPPLFEKNRSNPDLFYETLDSHNNRKVKNNFKEMW